MFVCFVSACACVGTCVFVCGVLYQTQCCTQTYYVQEQARPFPSGRVGSEDKTTGLDSPLEYSKQDYHKEES